MRIYIIWSPFKPPVASVKSTTRMEDWELSPQPVICHICRCYGVKCTVTRLKERPVECTLPYLLCIVVRMVSPYLQMKMSSFWTCWSMEEEEEQMGLEPFIHQVTTTVEGCARYPAFLKTSYFYFIRVFALFPVPHSPKCLKTNLKHSNACCRWVGIAPCSAWTLGQCAVYCRAYTMPAAGGRAQPPVLPGTWDSVLYTVEPIQCLLQVGGHSPLFCLEPGTVCCIL